MDLRYPPEAEAFRKDVRAFLDEHLPPGWEGIGALDREDAEHFTEGWRRLLAEHGLLGLSWPKQYGGAGLTKLEQVVLAEEFASVGVPTDPAAPKHKGITFLLCPLGQPGVEIRPIKMLSGESEFNEVFLSDVRTPAENVVGQVNGGWAVAMTLLGHERGEEAATNPVLFRQELDRLMALARERGRLADPIVRDRLASCYMRVEVMRFLGYRMLTGVLHGDGSPGPEASIAKLYWSEYHRQVTNLALDVLGPEA